MGVQMNCFCIQNTCNMAYITEVNELVAAAIRCSSMNNLDLIDSLELLIKY